MSDPQRQRSRSSAGTADRARKDRPDCLSCSDYPGAVGIHSLPATHAPGGTFMRCLVISAVTVIGLLAQSLHAEEPTLKYPKTRKGDVVDTLHGIKVADPYRWLEDDVRESKEVAAWVEAE